MSIETSAKAGHNVKALFKKIATALPGGESKEEVNTSRCKPGLAHAEIDVSSKGEEVPDASGCSC